MSRLKEHANIVLTEIATRLRVIAGPPMPGGGGALRRSVKWPPPCPAGCVPGCTIHDPFTGAPTIERGGI